MRSIGKHTPLAAKLVRIYEEYIGPFPGGSENAFIRRTRAGRIQRNNGAWSWYLWLIQPTSEVGGFLQHMGSPETAKNSVSDPHGTIEIQVPTNVGCVGLERYKKWYKDRKR